MKNRKRVIKDYPVLEARKDSCTHVRVQVYYALGGYNTFTGSNEERGLFLSVVPVEIAGGWESFGAFTGIKKSVKPMTRFSQKALDEYVPDHKLMNTLLDYVLEKQGIKLELDTILNGENDQPTTCPKCSSRTTFAEISETEQEHVCSGCGYRFYLESE
jgi:hypothetical protein